MRVAAEPPPGHTMATQEFGCPECGFMIRSENEDELIKVVQQHATDTHGMSMQKAEIRKGMETV